MNLLSFFGKKTTIKINNEDLRRQRESAQRAAADARRRLLDELSRTVLSDIHHKPDH